MPCPLCTRRSEFKEQDAIRYATKHNGRVLVWGGKNKTKWQCFMQHEWEAKWVTVRKHGSWCRTCSYQNRFKTKAQGSPLSLARKVLDSYRRRDKKKNRDCTVTLQQVLDAKASPCVYCGRKSSGFERIDNNLGHTPENCKPACMRCNWMRGRYISHEVMLQVGQLLRKIDP